MRRTTQTLGWLAVLMGVIHILLAFPIRDFRPGHLWYIGAGIAIVFAGFVNILGQSSLQNRTSFLLVVLANLIMCFLFVISTRVLQEPQSYLGIAIFASLIVVTVLTKRGNRT